MTELITLDDGLLYVDGGLTTDPNCCCYYEPPPPCPPCCVRIDWGTFNVDGDLYDQYEVGDMTIDVKIVMPVKNSRTVCQGDQVEVQWSVDGENTLDNSYIRFGPGWMLGGISPPIAEGDGRYDWGLVDWVVTEASEYSVGLEFRQCFLDTSQFQHFIIIGSDTPQWRLEIEITRCLSPEFCCRVPIECEDCCATLKLEDLIFFDTKYYKVVHNVDPQGNIYTMIAAMTVDDGRICDGGSVRIDIYLVPPRHSEGMESRTVLRTSKPWRIDAFAPPVGNDGEVVQVGTVRIDWGSLPDTEYFAVLSIGCNTLDIPCEDVLDFPVIDIENSLYGVLFFDFDKCDLTDCCPCAICDETLDEPCCFGRCVPMTDSCTRIVGYEFYSYEVDGDVPVNRFIQTTEDPYQDSGIHLGGCEFYMVYRFSEWNAELGQWGEESIVIDPDGFRYRNDGWYDGNAINVAIPGPCCGPIEGGYGPTNSGNPADFYNQRYAVVSFTVENPCDPSCGDEE